MNPESNKEGKAKKKSEENRKAEQLMVNLNKPFSSSIHGETTFKSSMKM